MVKVFPEVIRQLPTANIPIDGLRIFISHSETHEVWFLESDIAIDYPEHAHPAQWSVVLKGEIEVTTNGSIQKYSSGDCYFIPEGIAHSVKMKPGYAEVIFLNDPNLLSK